MSVRVRLDEAVPATAKVPRSKSELTRPKTTMKPRTERMSQRRGRLTASASTRSVPRKTSAWLARRARAEVDVETISAPVSTRGSGIPTARAGPRGRPARLPGPHHHGRRGTAHHVGAGEERRPPVGQGSVRGRRFRRLLDREGLAGEGGQDHHVPRHQLLGRDRELPAVTHGAHPHPHPLQQRLDGGLGRALLPEADQRARRDDREDDERLQPVSHGHRHGGRGDEQEDQRAPELSAQEGPPARAAAAPHAVGPEPVQP